MTQPEKAANPDLLTDEEFWGSYWEGLVLPKEIVRREGSHYLNQILDVFDRHLDTGDRRSVLEIGGAPGQYLAYVAKAFGHEISCLDYSDVGCQKTRDNLGMLGLRGTVYQGDLFSSASQLPAFDVVYSLGLIEHFADLDGVVQRHLQFLKPGGLLLLGCPNLTGVYHLFLRYLAPELLSRHNLRSMRLARWIEFERRFNLTVLFRGYVGGFEATVLDRCERDRLLTRTLRGVARWLVRVQNEYPNRLRVLRAFNGRLTSGYLLGVYRKPSERS